MRIYIFETFFLLKPFFFLKKKKKKKSFQKKKKFRDQVMKKNGRDEPEVRLESRVDQEKSES
jgi:hypothetical protein